MREKIERTFFLSKINTETREKNSNSDDKSQSFQDEKFFFSPRWSFFGHSKFCGVFSAHQTKEKNEEKKTQDLSESDFFLIKKLDMNFLFFLENFVSCRVWNPRDFHGPSGFSKSRPGFGRISRIPDFLFFDPLILKKKIFSENFPYIFRVTKNLGQILDKFWTNLDKYGQIWTNFLYLNIF